MINTVRFIKSFNVNCTGWDSEISLLLRWHCEWRRSVGGVGVSSNDAVAFKVSVSAAIICRHGLVERITRFAVKTYFSKCKSIIVLQHALHTHYGIPPHNTVPYLKIHFVMGEEFPCM